MSRDTMLFGVGLAFGAAVGVITAPWVYAPDHVADASKMVEPPRGSLTQRIEAIQADLDAINARLEATPTSVVAEPTGRVR